MGSAAGLYGCDLLGVLDVGNVENSYAAETVFLRDRDAALFFFFFIFVFILVDLRLWLDPYLYLLRRLSLSFVFVFVCIGGRRFRRKPCDAAIQTPIRHFYRHEQQILVHRDIALPARADHRSQHAAFAGSEMSKILTP